MLWDHKHDAVRCYNTLASIALQFVLTTSTSIIFVTRKLNFEDYKWLNYIIFLSMHKFPLELVMQILSEWSFTQWMLHVTYTDKECSNAEHSWYFSCQNIIIWQFVNECVQAVSMPEVTSLHTVTTHTHQHVQTLRLFALLRFYLPHVEFKLFAFKDIAITTSTLSRSWRHTRCNTSTTHSHLPNS